MRQGGEFSLLPLICHSIELGKLRANCNLLGLQRAIELPRIDFGKNLWFSHYLPVIGNINTPSLLATNLE